MTFRYVVCGLLAVGFLFFSIPEGFCQKITEMEPDRTFLMDTGERVNLAGILPEESAALFILAAVAGKDVRVEKATHNDSPASAVSPVYLYVEAKEIAVPYRTEAPVRGSKIMLNEFLLVLGLARVDESTDFKLKEHFLSLQKVAQEKGEGIWSYETPPR